MPLVESLPCLSADDVAPEAVRGWTLGTGEPCLVESFLREFFRGRPTPGVLLERTGAGGSAGGVPDRPRPHGQPPHVAAGTLGPEPDVGAEDVVRDVVEDGAEGLVPAVRQESPVAREGDGVASPPR